MLYSISFINKIEKDIINNEKLPDDVTNIIKELSNKVLSPDYCKTPVFKKKHNSGFCNYNKFISSSSTQIINDKDVVNDIKCLLNKLSKTTQNEITSSIIELMDSCDMSKIKTIMELIFDIKTESSLFIRIYSNVIKQIVDNNSETLDVIEEIITNINNKNINANVDSNDYDMFCKNNELMQKNTSKYILVAYLTVERVIDKKLIFNLLQTLQSDIMANVENEDYKNFNEYYIKNMCKILNLLNETNDYTDEIDNVNHCLLNILPLCSNKTKNKGLTNKSGFNIMDYCDENGLEY